MCHLVLASINTDYIFYYFCSKIKKITSVTDHYCILQHTLTFFMWLFEIRIYSVAQTDMEFTM